MKSEHEVTVGQAGEKKTEANLVLNGRTKWRARISTAVLCAAYVLINTAYSLIGPFFPLDVRDCV